MDDARAHPAGLPGPAHERAGHQPARDRRVAHRRRRAQPARAGPARACRSYADRLMAGMRADARASSTSTPRWRCARRSCGSTSTARRPPTSGSTCRTSRRRCRRSSPACRSRSSRKATSSTTSGCAPTPGRRRTPQDIADLTVQSRERAARAARQRRAAAARTLGPAQIDRLDRQRSITIVGNLLHGRAARRRHRRTPRRWRSASTCRRSTTSSGAGRAKGLAREQRELPARLRACRFLFMYMVLAAQFESFLHPITILLALPLVIPFALLLADRCSASRSTSTARSGSSCCSAW